MQAIQIVLVCFAVFAMSRVLIRFRRGGMRGFELFLWLVFWIAAQWLGVGRGVDTAMYLSLLVIFYLLFRAFGKMEDLDRQLTRVVRANALREMEEDLAAEKSQQKN
jgi:hypothetical protein